MVFSNTVQKVFRDAIKECQKRRHNLLTVEHILYAFTMSMHGRVLLEGCGASSAFCASCSRDSSGQNSRRFLKA